eukprot:2511711-Pleurochrysis_carterae.AAC.1
MDHALYCRSRLLVAHSFDWPSPRNPVFAATDTTQPANLQATSHRTRSQAQSAAATTASGTLAPAAPASSVSSS